MPKQFVLLTTRVDQWKDYFNNLTNKVGDIDLLTTSGEFVSGSDSDLVTAVNEVDYRLDSINNTQINSPHLFITDAGQTSVIKGNLNLHGNMDIGGTLTVDGVVNFKAGSSGSVTLGDSDTDNVVFNADVNSSIIPNLDNIYDLGDSIQEWKHLYLDGTAYVDNVAADSATITGDLDVQGITTLDSATVDGNLDITKDLDVAGITTLDSATVDGNLDITKDLDVAGITTLDSATVDDWLTSTKIRAASGQSLRLEADSGQDINLTANGRLFGSFSAPDAGSGKTQLIITNGSSDTMTLTDAGDLSLSGTGDFISGVTLNTTATKLAAAINEHEADIGSMSLNTTATDLTAAINEHEADIGTVGDLTTTATDLTAAINEHEADIGTVGDLTTTATNLTAAINELDSDIGPNPHTNLTTFAKNLTDAINEIDSDLGNLSELSMTHGGTNFAEAINYVHDRIPNIYDENDTLLN